MTIQPKQIQQLQTICSSKFHDRDERLDFMSSFFGQEINSTKDLTRIQADDLIYFMNTGNAPNNFSWGKFNKDNTQHKGVLSLCHQLGWVQEQNPAWVDINRLGSWLKSKRSPVQKPLMEMDTKEVSKIIFALEQMIKKRYK